MAVKGMIGISVVGEIAGGVAGGSVIRGAFKSSLGGLGGRGRNMSLNRERKPAAWPGRPKVVSFDLDGTLVDKGFDDAIWLSELPRIYAKQNGLEFSQAQKIFFAEYGKTTPQRLQWYDIGYWFRRMGLKIPARKVVMGMRHRLKLYPDVLPALKKLKRKKARMVVFTNSPRAFTEIKVRAEGLSSYFEKIVCVPSDYRKVKHHRGAFARLARECGVRPSEILHVGDSYELDYLPAKRAGCGAVLVERKGTPMEKRVKGGNAKKIATLAGLFEKC
jgi:putative hydrolase of the HAD superfamily